MKDTNKNSTKSSLGDCTQDYKNGIGNTDACPQEEFPSTDPRDDISLWSIFVSFFQDRGVYIWRRMGHGTPYPQGTCG